MNSSRHSRFTLASDDLFRDAGYRRLWLAVLTGAFGNQIGSLALALTAAALLHASPAQMGLLSAMGSLPFLFLLLPAGVWLDRVRKLPVYIGGEFLMAVALATVPLAWQLGRLDMRLLYAVAFAGGCVAVTAGTAAQIVLTQIVVRQRLVEAHARNSLATSIAEIAGPGLAGLLVKLAGAPLAIMTNCVLLLAGIGLLRGLRTEEAGEEKRRTEFWQELTEGIRFVTGTPLLRTLALSVAAWQVFQTAAMVVQVLYATRELGLDAYQFGLCGTAGGVGTVAAGLFVARVSRRIGPGRCLILGFAVSGAGWLLLASLPPGPTGVAAFVLMQLTYSAGTVLIFSNMLALRQAITPPALLGRMTSTMRWLTMLPAAPGALLGGWLGEEFGLRQATAFGAAGALLVAVLACRVRDLRSPGTPIGPAIT